LSEEDQLLLFIEATLHDGYVEDEGFSFAQVNPQMKVIARDGLTHEVTAKVYSRVLSVASSDKEAMKSAMHKILTSEGYCDVQLINSVIKTAISELYPVPQPSHKTTTLYYFAGVGAIGVGSYLGYKFVSSRTADQIGGSWAK
jgi:hypothetical protein